MAVKTYWQKAEAATLITKKIEILADNEFRVKYTQSGTERVDYFDFSAYTDESHPLYATDIGHNSVIQQYETYPSVVFNIFGQDEDEDAEGELEVSTYPHYLYRASGETETAETTIRTYTASLSDAQKLVMFKEAYREWEQQIETWLREGTAFTAISINILERGGQVFKAASYTLHQMALDTSIDKGELATITKLMTQGALDVSTPLEFAVYLNGLGQYFPNGPVKPRTGGVPTPGATHVPVGVLWVSDASGSWERVNSNAVVFYDSYEVPATYNPYDLTWLDSL